MEIRGPLKGGEKENTIFAEHNSCFGAFLWNENEHNVAMKVWIRNSIWDTIGLLIDMFVYLYHIYRNGFYLGLFN